MLGYAPGCIRVHDRIITTSVVLDATRIVTDWPPRRIEQLEAAHFTVILELRPEIIILGTGSATRFPPPMLAADIIQRGIGLEAMDNAAACRTYNVLVQERRRAVLALLIESAAG